MATALDIDIAGGRYRLIRCSGRGGTGTVYQAADMLLGRTVAVKILHASFTAELLRREGRSLARLQHPNVVALHDLVQADDRAYLVMEYVEGCDLDRWLEEHGPLRVEPALAVFRPIAAAIAHAHARGLLHCDLKPSNILVSVTGEIKLTDFTLAHALGPERAPGAVGGTAAFAAPEQLHGPSVDVRTDVYGLGALLRHLVYRSDERTPEAEQVARVIARATAENPDDRFASVGDMLAAAPAAAGGTTVVASASPTLNLTRVQPVAVKPRLSRRIPWRLAAIPTALVLAAAGLWAHFTATASPAPIVLPSLVSTDDRSAQLIAHSFALRSRLVWRYSVETPPGVVMRQIPLPGSEVARGATVTLVVSRGPRPVAVPNLGGLPESVAVAALRARGFHVDVQGQEEVFAEPDRVMAQTPAAGRTVLPHSLITLTVSRKPWWEFWRSG